MFHILRLAATALMAALFAHPVTAQGPQVGDKAPDFSLPGSDGKPWSLAQLKGKTVVLAWFPKAFTGG